MTICLVTDRHRLVAAVGAGPSDWADALAQQVTAAAEAGADLIQVREPDLGAAAMIRLVQRLVTACRGTPARIVVNDRLDVALASGAAGVHLKERSLASTAVRRLVSERFLVGCSIHSVGAAAERRDADYLLAGTVQATRSKQVSRLLGWEGLSAVVAAAAGKPVLGIGGLDLPSIPLLAATGAAGMAAIGAFIPLAGEDLVEFVQKRVIDVRLAFDSARPVF